MLLEAENKLSDILKLMLTTYGDFFTRNTIPDTSRMMELAEKMRDSIDSLLCIGISPLPDVELRLLEPAQKISDKIENA